MSQQAATTTGTKAQAAPSLSDLERKFVEAMAGPARWNATRAAGLAGYSTNSYGALRVTAHRLLHRPRVRVAINAAKPAWATTPRATGLTNVNIC